jgi:hypothetical protein
MDPGEDTFEAESVFPSEGSGTIRSSGFVRQRNWGLGWFTDGGRGNRGGNFWLDTPNLSARDTEAAAFFLLVLPHIMLNIKK